MQVYEKERQIQREVAATVEERLPDVEVLAAELSGPERLTVYIDHPAGVDHALCERVTDVLRSYLDHYTLDVSSPGLERPLRTPAHFARRRRPARGHPHEHGDRRPQALPRRGRRRRRARGDPRDRRRAGGDPVRGDRARQSHRRGIGRNHEPGDPGSRQADREGEGHRGRDARPRARGRPARRLQEDAGRSAARTGRARPRERRLPRLVDRAAPRTSRSACSTRRASARSPSSRRPRPRTASARTRSSPTTTSPSTGPTSTRRSSSAATSPPRTSAASPRRRPSR